jgi:excinuclease ABC subunit C
VFDSAALIAALPEAPGVYRMLGGSAEVLYVGKAKNLKKRVSSYFQRSQLSPRIRLMVGQIEAVDITATRSEAEALLLENNLIKSLQPRFNILFRDDKSYPYIVLSGDAFPRLGFHRGTFDKAAQYFGPFPSASAVRESIQLIQKVFLLRTCENSVFQNRSRPCLLHQIRRCSAPCVGLIAAQDYAGDVRLAQLFLKGRHGEVVERLSEKMHGAAQALAFEQAAGYRDQVRSLQKVLQRQFVESAGEEDEDIVVAVAERGVACVNLAMVRGGRHLGDHHLFPRNAQDCTPVEALHAFLDQHYAEHMPPPRVVVDAEGMIGDEVLGVTGAPGDGERYVAAAPRNEMERVWVAMARDNALLAIRARLTEISRTGGRVEALAAALDLAEPPARIECFDISHTGGEATVASCVVFAEGRMLKGEYRRYNVTGIVPGDDYAAMRQVLTRRYSKVAAGEGVRPDLILIDGGKGQLGVARDVLIELGLEDLAMVGVAKGEARKPGLEQLVFTGGRASLALGPEHAGLLLVQEIRDEAHRFAVAGHRARRAKTRRASTLENVAGIGPARRKRLLAQFGGLQGVLAATVDDLCRVQGISRKLAEQIHAQLH